LRDLRSYVVRIYRQQDAGRMVGTVQEVRTGRTVPFQAMEELWQAIGRTVPSAVIKRTRFLRRGTIHGRDLTERRRRCSRRLGSSYRFKQ